VVIHFSAAADAIALVQHVRQDPSLDHTWAIGWGDDAAVASGQLDVTRCVPAAASPQEVALAARTVLSQGRRVPAIRRSRDPESGTTARQP
jgi:hypothetical protein